MGPILEYICSQTSFEARETRTLEKLKQFFLPAYRTSQVRYV